MTSMAQLSADAAIYPFPDMPAPGQAMEVADGIFWASLRLPFIGLTQVNIWLLRDGDGWTMLDTGYGDAATQAELQVLWGQMLGGRPVTRLILTHFHPDHAGNSGFVARHWGGLLPLMSQAEWLCANLAWQAGQNRDDIHARVAHYRAHGLDAARCAALARELVTYDQGVMLPPATRRMRDGDVLKIGGDAWQVVVGEGHSPEHVSLWCPARNILLAGDQVLPSITPNLSVWAMEPEGDPVGLYLASCRRFLGLLDPETLVLPSHRRPFTNGPGRLRELLAHHAERLEVVRRAAVVPVNAADILPAMFPRPLDGHQLGFAMGEALAHLNHLAESGVLARQVDKDGVVRFVQADLASNDAASNRAACA